MRNKINKFFDRIINNVKYSKLETLSQIEEWTNGGENPKFPVFLQTELSNICNAQCAMCYLFSPFSKEKSYLKKEDAFFNLKMLKSLENILKHTFCISLFGYGEPLLHPDFKKCLSLIKKYRLYTTFFTNAKLLSKDYAKYIVNAKVAKVTISFSGSDKQTYENIYIGCDFEKTLENIKYLSDYKKKKHSSLPIIEVNTIGFQKHVETLDKFVELMRSVGVDNIILNPLLENAETIPHLYKQSCVPRKDKEVKIIEKAKNFCEANNILFVDFLSTTYTAGNEEEYRKYHEMLSKTNNETSLCECNLMSFKEEADKIKITPKNLNEFYRTDSLSADSTYKECEKAMHFKEFETEFVCTQPNTVMYIKQNGAVKPCCNYQVPSKNDKGILLGNIKNDDPYQIFNSNAFKIMRNKAKEHKYPSEEGCSYCMHYKCYPAEDSYKYYLRDFAAYYEKAYKDNTFTVLCNKLFN